MIVRVEKGPQGRARGATGLFAGWTDEERNQLFDLLTNVQTLTTVTADELDKLLSAGQPPYDPPRSSPKMRLLARLRAL
jgi:hypothetical protein